MFASAQVGVSFSLSLELLSYQKLPAEQMLPGVDIQQHAGGEKEMVFTQSLILEHANRTTQVSPGPARLGGRQRRPDPRPQKGAEPGPRPEGPVCPGRRLAPSHVEK